MDSTTIATILRQLRQRRHLTQKDLAQHMNVTHQAVSRWENGMSVPDIQTLMALAQFYDVSVDAILGKSAMYVPDNDNLARANRLIDRLWRFGLVPMVLFGVALALSLTWFVSWDRPLQWTMTILLTTLLIGITILVRVHSKRRGMAITYLVVAIVLFASYLVTPTSFHRIDVAPLVAASSTPISLPVMEAEVLTYVDSRSGEDHIYGVLFEVESDTLYLISLDPNAVSMTNVTVPRGSIQNVFVYDEALHVATFDTTNDIHTTRIYRLNDERTGWTLPFVRSGWYNAYAGSGRLLLVPSPLVESGHEDILEWDNGAFEPIASIYEPIHDMVLHHDTYVSIYHNNNDGNVSKVERNFREYRVMADTNGFHQEAPTLTEAGLATVIHSNQGQHLIRNGEHVASLPGDSPVTYSGGDYFLQEGALYDLDWNLVSRTTFESDDTEDARASYLFFHPQGGYVAVTNDALIRLNQNPIDPIVLDRFTRATLFMTAGLVAPLVIIGAMRRREVTQ